MPGSDVADFPSAHLVDLALPNHTHTYLEGRGWPTGDTGA